MEVKDGLRYRGPIIARAFGRKSKDGLNEFIDFTVGVDQFFNPTTGKWEPMGDYGQPIEASYFIRSKGELDTNAIQNFANATGWDCSPEQFDDESWVPAKVQIRLKMKPKADGNGHWLTFTAIAAFDATQCGGSKSETAANTLSEFRRLMGKPPVIPKTTPPPLEPGDEIPF